METTQTVQENKKMMACKTCGAQMAKSAKKCPSCGAKNARSKWMGKLKKLIIFVVKFYSMTDENVNTGFDEHNDNPLESHGFEKVARKGNFPTMLDLIAMLLIIVLSQAVVSVVGVALGLPMPDMLSGDVVDIEQFIGEQVVRGQSFAVIYPLSMILAFALLYIYIIFRDGRGKVARASVRGFNPNVILGGLIWLIAVQVVVEPLSLLLPAEDQASGQGFWAIVTAVIFAPVFDS